MMENTTTIVGGLSEFKETPKPTKSLLQRIKEAPTIKDVQDLLEVGSTYKKAKNETLRKWSRAASTRMKQLGLK